MKISNVKVGHQLDLPGECVWHPVVKGKKQSKFVSISAKKSTIGQNDEKN